MANVDSKITIKLLIDANNRKVLFGEAGKDFIDFMLSLLTLPLGSVIRLLSPKGVIGSIGNLYKSVQSLNETYLLPNKNKSAILQPKIFTSDITSPLLLGAINAMSIRCTCCNRRSSTTNNICLHCELPTMSSNGGFVKELVTYMVTDDLEVTPMSAISSITLINRFIIKGNFRLEEKVVTVSMKEGLSLLKASLISSTVLTDVFCP